MHGMSVEICTVCFISGCIRTAMTLAVAASLTTRRVKSTRYFGSMELRLLPQQHVRGTNYATLPLVISRLLARKHVVKQLVHGLKLWCALMLVLLMREDRSVRSLPSSVLLLPSHSLSQLS